MGTLGIHRSTKPRTKQGCDPTLKSACLVPRCYKPWLALIYCKLFGESQFN